MSREALINKAKTANLKVLHYIALHPEENWEPIIFEKTNDGELKQSQNQKDNLELLKEADTKGQDSFHKMAKKGNIKLFGYLTENKTIGDATEVAKLCAFSSRDENKNFPFNIAIANQQVDYIKEILKLAPEPDLADSMDLGRMFLDALTSSRTGTKPLDLIAPENAEEMAKVLTERYSVESLKYVISRAGDNNNISTLLQKHVQSKQEQSESKASNPWTERTPKKNTDEQTVGACR